MFRIPAVILLSLCVAAMPSYVAVRCSNARDQGSDAQIHECCPVTTTAFGVPTGDDGDEKHSPISSQQSCAAPCCGYVAHVVAGPARLNPSNLLANLLPPVSESHAAVDREAIFHPPRI